MTSRTMATVVLVLTLAMPARLPAEKRPADAPGDELIYARIGIDGIGSERLRYLQLDSGVLWWIELDQELLVLADGPTLELLQRAFVVDRLTVEPVLERLRIIRGARRVELSEMEADLLALGGRYAVVQTREGWDPVVIESEIDHGHGHVSVLPFRPNSILARQSANRLRAKTRVQIRSRDLVDEQRWFNDVTTLAGYNRWTHGDEIHQARDWLVQQFEQLPGLTVTTPTFEVGATPAYNVVGTLIGRSRPEEIYIVGAHYDAISQAPSTSAPGAEDNATGCAGVIEMARIFTANPPDATVLFICYSGEEQGLHGSVDHASELVASGLDDQVMAVLTMDMIGYSGDADLDCLLETSAEYAGLADAFAAAAEATDLRIVISFNPFGSDHVPYLNRGMPALLAIENDWDIYPCYHTTCDTPDNVTLAMGREILEMNVLAVSELVGVATIFADGFESGSTSSWSETVEPFGS